MLGIGGVGGGGAGLDLSALLQVVVVGLVLLSAAFVAVRRAASRYFVVDAAGFAASCEDHPPPQVKKLRQQQQQPWGMAVTAGAGERAAACEACGGAASKKCTGCKRVRYCSQECQSKHWQAEHKFRCRQMKLLDNGDKLPSRDESNGERSGFGPISLVPARGKENKFLFPYEEFLKLYNWKDLDLAPCGLLNCGNSCFANVVLQCLSCTRPLVAYLLGKDHRRECARRHDDWCFLCELQCHVQRASESLHPFAPMNILSHLPNIGGNLGFGRQEDAHEFMRFAIDKMQSACLDEFGGEKALDLTTQETTVIQHIFGGHLQSQVKCTNCGMISNRYDNMMDLTVEIQGDAESLEECLDQFTAVEWLDGDNKYKCDGCDEYVKAWKRLTVHQAPNILTITLKRFQSGRFGKLNKRITFRMMLDLAPYMSSTGGSDLYELYAVVVHLDLLNASFFGHYICYTKDYRGQWYKIDDCKVMTVGEDEVLAQGAYMLLYSRKIARPTPLTAPKEPLRQWQQCEVLPNGHNHVSAGEDESLNIKASSNSLASDKEVSRKMAEIYQETDLYLDVGLGGQKSSVTGNIQTPDVGDLPSSSVSGILEEWNRIPGSQQEGSTLNQLGSSTREESSVRLAAVQCQTPAVSSHLVDHMEVNADTSTTVKRWNEQTPALDYSFGRMDGRTPEPTSENGSAGRPKELFSRGFLDKPSRKKHSVVEGASEFGYKRVAYSPQRNGYCNGHSGNVEQERYVHSSGGNGDLVSMSNNSNSSFVNGDSKSNKDPFRGFTPRPYSESSARDTSSKKTNDCKGDMSFFRRGFLDRPYISEGSAKDSDILRSNNGTLSFVNGDGKSSNHMSAGNGQESLVTVKSGDHVQERWSSDCTTSNLAKGTCFEQSAGLSENGHVLLGTKKNACFGDVNDDDDNSDGNGHSSYRGDDRPALLASERSAGSEKVDRLKFVSGTAFEPDGLRRRLAPNFFKQNGVDAQ